MQGVKGRFVPIIMLTAGPETPNSSFLTNFVPRETKLSYTTLVEYLVVLLSYFYVFVLFFLQSFQFIHRLLITFISYYDILCFTWNKVSEE